MLRLYVLNVCACSRCTCVYVCVRVFVYVCTFSKTTCAYVSWFLQRMLYTLVLDYKFHNLTLHSNFNSLAIPHTHTRTHTHTYLHRFNACTLARCASLNWEFQSLVLLFDLFLVLLIFHICALFLFHIPDSFLLKIQFIYSEEILLLFSKQILDNSNLPTHFSFSSKKKSFVTQITMYQIFVDTEMTYCIFTPKESYHSSREDQHTLRSVNMKPYILNRNDRTLTISQIKINILE